jgi:methyltransferase (TIGR00027 family)
MAMGKGTEQSSETALGVLATVCVAGSEPDPCVRIEDPIAPRLLRWSDGKYAAARLRALHPIVRRAIGRQAPGAYGLIIARIHHMDAVVRQEVDAGLDRIVILGAGYDTRAYRMREQLDGVPVIEVDHPATSRDKRARLAKAIDSVPDGVTYLEVDFTHENLLERLGSVGHALSDRTLFVLSGVTPYLTAEAVSELLDQVAAHTSSRTSLLFDYIFEDVLTEPEKYYGGPEWVPYATKAGEEPRFGIPEEGIEGLLDEHGLRLAHLETPEATERYLRRADGGLVARPYDFGGLAHAFVNAR